MPETFIRPAELSRTSSRLISSVFNAYRLLLGREPGGFVFLPLRNIQFQAIAGNNEILFVDSLGPYHRDAENGGRCISFSWQFTGTGQRNSISRPANYDFIRYCNHTDVDNNRLITELSFALQKHAKSQLSSTYQNRKANIITLKQ